MYLYFFFHVFYCLHFACFVAVIIWFSLLCSVSFFAKMLFFKVQWYVCRDVNARFCKEGAAGLSFENFIMLLSLHRVLILITKSKKWDLRGMILINIWKGHMLLAQLCWSGFPEAFQSSCHFLTQIMAHLQLKFSLSLRREIEKLSSRCLNRLFCRFFISLCNKLTFFYFHCSLHCLRRCGLPSWVIFWHIEIFYSLITNLGVLFNSLFQAA